MERMDLGVIAARLEGLEETIIGRLIDRAQFALNPVVYRSGMSGFEGEPSRSLFDVRLLYQERMDALFGRFMVPEERPFNRDLPRPSRKVVLPPDGLAIGDYDIVNLTPEISERYVGFLPSLCTGGDDGQYGSGTEHDVYAVQAIARRIHYGALYVAESKYREQPEAYRRLVRGGDIDAVTALLTRTEVEERIIARIGEKTAYLQERVNRLVRKVIDPGPVAAFYRSTVIPLTKKGEVLYLMNRRDDP